MKKHSQNSGKNELYYINTTKTMAIVLVMLTHLSVTYDLRLFSNSFHLSLFFICTGILFSLKQDNFIAFVKHKFRHLIVPFFFFAIISYIYYVIVGRNFGNETDGDENLLKYIVGIFYAPASKEFLGFNFPIWFLPCLFVCEIIFFLILKYLPKYTILTSCILFIIGILVKETIPFRLPWGGRRCFVLYTLHKHRLYNAKKRFA
ncbi:acyltransferase family protein [Dysgonomonas sp. 520]|uniref:acyltransferase family protein n=1 Tax=Dysgonomonas sp. 520 TaxID=2302931 RepID=UPI0013D67408|nr:hypothetical protein [Dysgonomonas sp. 520]